MQTDIREENGVCVYGISGDIDLYSAPDMHRKYLELAGRGKQWSLVIDLGRTEYLDSSGIGVLVQITADTRAKKIPFALCNVRGMAQKLLRLSRMDSILPIEPDMRAALARIGNRET